LLHAILSRTTSKVNKKNGPAFCHSAKTAPIQRNRKHGSAPTKQPLKGGALPFRTGYGNQQRAAPSRGVSARLSVLPIMRERQAERQEMGLETTGDMLVEGVSDFQFLTLLVRLRGAKHFTLHKSKRML
jgi:hypothetical protein